MARSSLINLRDKKLFLFDMDGVLLKGKDRPVKIGGGKIIEKLRGGGRQLRVVTNNSTDTVEAVWKRLNDQDIRVRKKEVLTSARLTAEFIARMYGGARYFLVGEAGFEQELNSVGLKKTYG